MGRNSFDFFVPAMLRKLKSWSTRRESGFLGLASVCSCATTIGVHKARRITKMLGNRIVRKWLHGSDLRESISGSPAWTTVTKTSVYGFQIRHTQAVSKLKVQIKVVIQTIMPKTRYGDLRRLG